MKQCKNYKGMLLFAALCVGSSLIAVPFSPFKTTSTLDANSYGKYAFGAAAAAAGTYMLYRVAKNAHQAQSLARERTEPMRRGLLGSVIFAPKPKPGLSHYLKTAPLENLNTELDHKHTVAAEKARQQALLRGYTPGRLDGDVELNAADQKINAHLREEAYHPVTSYPAGYSVPGGPAWRLYNYPSSPSAKKDDVIKKAQAPHQNSVSYPQRQSPQLLICAAPELPNAAPRDASPRGNHDESDLKHTKANIQACQERLQGRTPDQDLGAPGITALPAIGSVADHELKINIDHKINAAHEEDCKTLLANVASLRAETEKAFHAAQQCSSKDFSADVLEFYRLTCGTGKVPGEESTVEQLRNYIDTGKDIFAALKRPQALPAATKEHIKSTVLYLYYQECRKQGQPIEDLALMVVSKEQRNPYYEWLYSSPEKYKRPSTHCEYDTMENMNHWGIDIDNIIPGNKNHLLFAWAKANRCFARPEPYPPYDPRHALDTGKSLWRKIPFLRDNWNIGINLLPISQTTADSYAALPDDHFSHRKERTPEHPVKLFKKIMAASGQAFNENLVEDAQTKVPLGSLKYQGIRYMAQHMKKLLKEKSVTPGYERVYQEFLAYLNWRYGEETVDLRNGNEGVAFIEKL